MPRYDYKCDECQIIFEIDHPMEDTMDFTPCWNSIDEGCEGYLHKMFRPTAISFKGSGWGKVYGTYKPKKID